MTRGFGVFIDSFCEELVISVLETGDDDTPSICIYPTEREAQLEIVDYMMTRLQEFIDGEREFEDAMPVSEYVMEVEICDCGKITVIQ